jgi:hypothetical protein
VHPQLTDHSLLVHLDRPLVELLEVFQLVQIHCLSRSDSLHAGVLLPLPASPFAFTFHHTPCNDLFFPALYTPCCSTLPCCIPHTTRTDLHCHTHHTMPPAGIGFDAVANAPVRTHPCNTTLPSTVHMGASVLQICTRHTLAGAGSQRMLVRYCNAFSF